MVDVEKPQPALLSHGERDEATELHELGLGEVRVQALPEAVVGIEPPRDRLGVSERGLLALAVFRGLLEIDEIVGLGLLETAAEGLDRALIAAELARHGARDVEPA